MRYVPKPHQPPRSASFEMLIVMYQNETIQFREYRDTKARVYRKMGEIKNTIPHENGRNSETKSRKIDPKVPKRNQRQALRTPLCQKTDFGPKYDFLYQKLNSLSTDSYVLATPSKVVQRKKYPFPQ